jgi:hypothetical protein
MEISAALEPPNAPHSHRSGPNDAEGVAEQHDLICANEHLMDPDPETRGMIKLDRPCEQLEWRVDVLEERPAERGLITKRSRDVLRRDPAGGGPEPNEQADRREDDAHRIPLTSR